MKRGVYRQIGLCLGLIGLAAGCSKKSPEAAAPSPQPKASAPATAAVRSSTMTPAPQDPAAAGFACTLLTPEEVAAVQGEAPKATKASAGSGPGLKVSQCYFELPTIVNSIVLTVTRKGDGPDARDPKTSWHEIFYGERKRDEEEEEREGKSKELEKVEGLGDEAIWTGTRVGGALYVLKGDAYIRISVGGAGDKAEKTKRSRALAESVLRRL
ncbi:MAG TPA: hypothetical protein VM940_06895 [Chthoniobacterales bacterium]|nr:hypothetical protein [Chthoniobacterales bacterium]